MNLKRLSLRFNLDNKEDLQVWELIHRDDNDSINSDIIHSIIRAHEQSDLESLIRRVLSEELSKRQLNTTADNTQPLSESENEENMQIIFDFLDSF